MLFIGLFCSLTAFAASPTTARELYEILSAAQPKTKAEALAALPEEMKKNFLLVKKSRSRQRGTPGLPRVIHFTKNAALIATSSDVPNDPAADFLEVMELDRNTGLWTFSSIAITAGVKEPVVETGKCNGCHGQVAPRPLWGEYPNWPSSYGGSDTTGAEHMAPEEYAEFQNFLANGARSDGYRHLRLIPNQFGFTLPDTSYGYPNTVFTTRLGARVAEALYKRVRNKPAYARYAYSVVALSLDCRGPEPIETMLDTDYQYRLSHDPDFSQRWSEIPATLSLTKVLRLLDLDPARDFRLDELPRFFSPNRSEESLLLWNAGSDYLRALLNFEIFRNLWLGNAKLQSLLSDRSAMIEKIQTLAFEADPATLEAAERSSEDYLLSLFPYLHTNVFDPAAKNPEFCAEIRARALETLKN
jgi:hypothetical protein